MYGVRTGVLQVSNDRSQYLMPPAIDVTETEEDSSKQWGQNLGCIEPERYLGCKKANTELWTIPNVGHCPDITYALCAKPT